jgi:DNA-binding CsgD family transcriptional regulator
MPDGSVLGRQMAAMKQGVSQGMSPQQVATILSVKDPRVFAQIMNAYIKLSSPPQP